MKLRQREDNYDHASLFRRTYKTIVIDERQDDDTSITCSIKVAQTENKVLEAGSLTNLLHNASPHFRSIYHILIKQL